MTSLNNPKTKDDNVSFDVKEGKLFTNELESLEEAANAKDFKEPFSNIVSRMITLHKFNLAQRNKNFMSQLGDSKFRSYSNMRFRKRKESKRKKNSKRDGDFKYSASQYNMRKFL